jgi:hypothetical protein
MRERRGNGERGRERTASEATKTKIEKKKISQLGV